MDTWKAEPCRTLEWHRRFRSAALPIATKGVGLVLASYANMDGTSVRPGMAALMECTGLEERQLRRHLTAIRTAGWAILICTGSSFGRSAKTSEYRLSYPAEVTT